MNFMKLGALTVIALFAHALSAESPVGFSFESSLGILLGDTHECVIENGKIISRLDWQNSVTPALLVKGTASISHFFLGAGVVSALPVKNGVMKDYDFLIAGTNQPSHYSQHDAYLDKYFDVLAEFGYRFTAHNWKIIPALGFRYRNRKWSAQDGYLQYPGIGVWTGNETKQNTQGTVISYEQAIWFPLVAADVSYTFVKKIEIALCVNIFPHLWAETIDSHFLRKTQFYDTMQSNFGFNVGISVLYHSERLSGIAFKLNAVYENLGDFTGTTASGDIGVSNGGITPDSGYKSRMKTDGWSIMAGILWQLK